MNCERPLRKLLLDVFYGLPREALGAQALAAVALRLVPVVDPRLPFLLTHARPLGGHVPRQTRLARQIDALGDLEAILRLTRALRLGLPLDSQALPIARLLVHLLLLPTPLLLFDYCVRLSLGWRLQLPQAGCRALLSSRLVRARCSRERQAAPKWAWA